MAGDDAGMRHRRTRRTIFKEDERGGPAGATSRRNQDGEGRSLPARGDGRGEKSGYGGEAPRSPPDGPPAKGTLPRRQVGGTAADAAATVIQTRFRGFLARRRSALVLRSVVRIQAWWRAASAARRYAALRARAQAARARDRKSSVRREYTEFKERQLENVRGLDAAKVSKYLERIQSDAAVAIQRRWRGRAARRRVGLDIKTRCLISPRQGEGTRPWDGGEEDNQKGQADLKPFVEKIVRRLEAARANRGNQAEEEDSGFPGIAENTRAVDALLTAYKAKAKAARGVTTAALLSAERVAACDHLIRSSPPLSQSDPSTVRLLADAGEGGSQRTILQARRAHRQHLKLARQTWWQAVADGRYPEQVMDGSRRFARVRGTRLPEFALGNAITLTAVSAKPPLPPKFYGSSFRWAVLPPTTRTFAVNIH